jgi:hypothetical protein
MRICCQSVSRLLAAALLALAAVGPQAEARSFGAKLSGRELLVELEKTKAGAEAPGIYAIGEDGAITPIISYGRHPRWSPDHKRIAFQLGLETWVADLTDATMRPLEEISVFADSPYNVLTFTIAHAIEWTPEGDGVIRWNGPDMDHEGWVGALELVRLNGRPPWNSEELLPGLRGKVGRISISADGAYIAYEKVAPVLDIGVLDREVMIMHRKSGEATAVRLPELEAKWLLNPRWGPRGRRLALDCIRANLTRFSVIHDLATGQIWRFTGKSLETRDWSEALEWSPDGRHLLLATGTDGGRGYTWTSLVEWDGESAPRVIRDLGHCFHSYQACWSPTGDRVAVLQGDEFSLDQATFPEVLICTLDNELTVVKIPDCLRPVSIDW